jgi:hypothetical protein
MIFMSSGNNDETKPMNLKYGKGKGDKDKRQRILQ